MIKILILVNVQLVIMGVIASWLFWETTRLAPFNLACILAMIFNLVIFPRIRGE